MFFRGFSSKKAVLDSKNGRTDPPIPPPRIISIHYLYWLLTRVYRKVGKKKSKKKPQLSPLPSAAVDI